MLEKEKYRVKLSLQEAAHLISELSGHYMDRPALWYQCKQGKINYERIGNFLVVEKEDAVEFAKNHKGAIRGPQKLKKIPEDKEK